MGRSIFFEKNLSIQFDVVFYSESNGGIFYSLALLLVSYDDLKFLNLCDTYSLREIVFGKFFCLNR